MKVVDLDNLPNYDAAKKRDIEWAVWKQGERSYSIPTQMSGEEAAALKPEDYIAS